MGSLLGTLREEFELWQISGRPKPPEIVLLAEFLLVDLVQGKVREKKIWQKAFDKLFCI